MSAAAALPARLAAAGLARRYHLGAGLVRALEDVSLTAAPGEVVAVVGPSGCGKSTLLQLLGGLDVPDAGAVVIDGRSLGALGARERVRLRRERIGFVFQFLSLIPVLTAVENVEYPLLLRGVVARERHGRAQALLERVGLAGREGHRPAELSGGEQQRVAIARALAGGGDILLADEPTAHLDSVTGAGVVLLLAGLARERGATVVLATHDARLVAHADTVVRLCDGRRIDA